MKALTPEEKARRSEAAKELCERVKMAFLQVELGAGIGLFEAQAIDDYESTDVRAQRREKDEKLSWDRIESKHLNACYSSLNFFDSLGMRFHLPAFIIAELRSEYEQELTFTLTHLNRYTRDQFGLLSPSQRQVVREYLEFLRGDPSSEFDFEAIDRALSEYWKDQL